MNEWKPTKGIEPTQELMDIITCDRSVSVLACAGAGKTELLAQKANYLLVTGICPWPKRILSLTFKTEAQANIKVRIGKRCGEASSRFDSFTFHAFCKSVVDRFKNILPLSQRPHDGYDIVFKESEAKKNSKILMERLIDMAIIILKEREDVRAMFSNSYSHVFVDEFQDTTNKQYELLKLLFQGTPSKLLSVGDINQSIMLWADARETVFDDFLNDFSAEQKYLLKNYRASDEIGRVLDVFIDYIKNPTEEVDSSDVSSPNCSVSIFSNEVQEAKLVSQSIKALIDGGVNNKDICILTKQQSALYTERISGELARLGIEHADMNELQDAFKEPLGLIFSQFLKALFSPSLKNTMEIYGVALSLNRVEIGDKKEHEIVSTISQYIAQKREQLNEQTTIDELISYVVDFVHFLDLGKIKGRWKQYRSVGFYQKTWNTLETRLRQTYAQVGGVKDSVVLFNSPNTIHIMNIHKCKGLEYDYVYFVGLEDQAFWNYKSQTFEDNCAIYVALSRARKSINITYSMLRANRSYSQWRDNRPSSWSALSSVYKVLLHKCKFQRINHTE